MRKEQIIISGVVLAAVLLFVLIFSGLLPGLREPKKQEGEIVLRFWGLEDYSVYREIIDKFQTLYPEVKIEYHRLKQNNYEKNLIDALAAGRGPDIFVLKNTWLAKHKQKISPLANEKFGADSLKQLFPRIVEQDFIFQEKVYALPSHIETLFLIYNQDIFDRQGIALLPKTWFDFQEIIPKLTKIQGTRLIRAGAAIGGSNESIDQGTDLLFALMLQAGCPMTDQETNRALFSRYPACLAALEFYTDFADPKNRIYTWDDNFGYSLDLFAKEKTAIIFNYLKALPELRRKNPHLNIGYSPLPQMDLERPINYSEYWAYTVSRQSLEPDRAWDFILFLTTNRENASLYFSKTKKFPALRTLIDEHLRNPESTLTAQSWFQTEPEMIEEIFSDMIELINQRRIEPWQALEQIEEKITDLMKK